MSSSVCSMLDAFCDSIQTRLFLASFRERTFALLTTAFSSIPLPIAVRYLGLPSAEVLRGDCLTLFPLCNTHPSRFLGAENADWSYDATTKILFPKPQATPKNKQGSGIFIMFLHAQPCPNVQSSIYASSLPFPRRQREQTRSLRLESSIIGRMRTIAR